MQRAKQAESTLAEQLHAAELAHRDEKISQLSATVMSKELEIASLKSRLATMGEMVATLTSDA